jgi:hypothetical protein
MSAMHRRKFVASAAGALLGGVLVNRAPAADPVPPASEPGLILRPGPPGWWDSERVSCPRVLREGNGQWRMWYYGRDPTFNRAINLPSGRSGMATSKDGIHWERVRGPLTMGAVLEPSVPEERFDSGHVGITDVHPDGSGYLAWYLGGSRRPGNLGGVERVGFPVRPGRASSPDGLHWTRFVGPFAGALLDVGAPDSFDPYLVGWPQVLREDDGTFKLYYQTLQPRSGFMTCLAVSHDGDHWEKLGPVFKRGADGDFDEGGPATRQVIKQGREYLMFYEATDRARHFSIGLARSDDGVNWKRVRGPEEGGSILAHSPADSGRWDAAGIGTPWVVANGHGGYHLYFVGANPPPGAPAGASGELSLVHQIGLAVSEDGDFTRWKRWDGAST